MKLAFAFYFQILNLMFSLEQKSSSPVVTINIFKLSYAEAEGARRYVKSSNVFMSHDFEANLS